MEERKKWIDIVEKFRNDINVIVNCPHCKKEDLVIKDVAFNDNEINKVGERFIECLICGKFEIVLYRKPPENWYLKNI
ncbi:hypothetical protein EV144_1011494 [Flavobacterium sp. 270]|uniref:hypothetical protein n=1 Tax=Flavobacterium sp. 270 TaxID=2512114 RepID=UPI0010662544|nr:hypothetical protein [Flavobacterium sp. 270]TDW52801.1 hypothetical protein EV144_1011494 [Flavobacterium sp. 270]